MPKGILFPLDEREPLAAQDFNDLSEYLAAVDGYVELIQSGLPSVAFLANEDGKLQGLSINRRATLFWWLHLPAARFHDVLVGNVVLIGLPDHSDDFGAVPDPIQQLLITASDFYVELTVAGEDQWHRNPIGFEDYFEATAWALDLTARRQEIVGQVRVVGA